MSGNFARCSPVEAVAGVDLHPSPVQVGLQAIAVVLDFVEPAVAGGLLRPERRELRRDESRHLGGPRALDRPRQKTGLGTLRHLRYSQKPAAAGWANDGQSTRIIPRFGSLTAAGMVRSDHRAQRRQPRITLRPGPGGFRGRQRGF